MHLGQNAAQTPHIDGHVVLDTKDDFRCTIEATLNVCVDCEEVSGTGSENPMDLPLSSSRQLLPKSMTFMPLFAGWRSSMFYKQL